MALKRIYAASKFTRAPETIYYIRNLQKLIKHCVSRQNLHSYSQKNFFYAIFSFKDRGALNALLNLKKEERARGVITTSAGNHAQGLAHQGQKLSIPVTVVMPVRTPLVKV